MNKPSSNNNSILYRADVIPFVASVAGFCALVDSGTTPRWTHETLAECRRELAAVYATGVALQKADFVPMGELEPYIRQEDYDRVENRLVQVFGEYDRFLTTQVEEMKYSDVPISVSTSELLADLYQALGDTLWAFTGQNETRMLLALDDVQDQLLHELGDSLLLVLKQLHDLLAHPDFDPYPVQDH